MLETEPRAVFLDACVFVGASFNMKSRDLGSLESLVANGTLYLVTTDIIVREVRANIAEKIRIAKSRHEAFRNRGDLAVLRGTQTANYILKEFPTDTVVAELQGAFSDYLARTKTLILKTDSLTAGTVLSDYFDHKPPFGEGRKKSEFPDAFSLVAVREWQAAKLDESLFFVTDDDGIAERLRTLEDVEHHKTVRSLLDAIYSQDEPRARFIKFELLKQREELMKWAADVFADLDFDIKERVEGEVLSVRVERVEMTDDPEDLDIVQMGDGSATLITPVDAEFHADLKYDDGAPYWFDEVEETVTRREECLDFEMQVRFQGLDPNRFEIEKVDFPDREIVFVETSRDEECH